MPPKKDSKFVYTIQFPQCMMMIGISKNHISPDDLISNSLVNIFSNVSNIYNYRFNSDIKSFDCEEIVHNLEHFVNQGVIFKNDIENRNSLKHVLINWTDSILQIRFMSIFENVREIIMSISDFDRIDYEINCKNLILKNYLKNGPNSDVPDSARNLLTIDDIAQHCNIDYFVNISECDKNKNNILVESIRINDFASVNDWTRYMQKYIPYFNSKRREIIRIAADLRSNEKNIKTYLIGILNKPIFKPNPFKN